MARPRSGPTLAPSFREFMPQWLARQRWYLGVEVPVLRPVGAFRLEDPDGEVGLETQLVTDGDEIYQIPMTYRGAALAKGALIATAEHSVLGIRWIYDATTDPVWEAGLLRLVQAGGTGGPSGRGGTQEVEVHGELPVPGIVLTADTATIELIRVLKPGGLPRGQGIAGVVLGSWHPEPDLALVQAEAALAELEALLDRPSQPCCPDQPCLGAGLPVRDEAVVKGQFAGLQVAADQQAVLRGGGGEPGPWPELLKPLALRGVGLSLSAWRDAGLDEGAWPEDGGGGSWTYQQFWPARRSK